MSGLEDVGEALRQAVACLPTGALTESADAFEEVSALLYEALADSNDPEAGQLYEQAQQSREQLLEAFRVCQQVGERLNSYLSNLGIGSGGIVTPVKPEASPQAQEKPATPQQWAEAKRKELPERPGGRGPTTGIYRDKSGNEQTIISGTDETSEAINDYLWSSSAFPSFRKDAKIDVNVHSETKLAWRMRRDAQKHSSIVVNNVMCHRNRRPFYTCQRAIRAILPRGYSMEVWESEGSEPVVIQGTAEE